MSVTIKDYERRHPKLGRRVRHDSRSLDFPFPTEGLTVQSVVHERHIPILDQGEVGSCTAETGIGSLATSPLFEALPAQPAYSLDQDGALQLYSDEEIANGFGPYPPNDFGSDGLTCAKVLKKAGLISSYRHCFSTEAALKALSVTPFMFGTDWHDKMFDPDPDGRVHIQGPIAGGHEILCREFDQPRERVWFDNSWGVRWGLAGRFYLSVDDFEKLLKHDGDVTIMLPLAGPPPIPTPGPSATRRRRHHHHHGVVGRP